MKSIIPTVIMIMGITILTLVASCLISFQLQISSARDFHSNCIDRIQSSYFSEDVINDCVTNASTEGYTLTVDDQSIDENRPCQLISLVYSVKMPLFGNINKTTSLEGYAK